MKLRDILRPIGAVASVLHPGIGAAISVVNQFLPDKDKIPANATPDQVVKKIDGLAPDVQVKILESEIAIPMAEINSEVARIKAMADVDQQSTRPKIAFIMAWHLVAQSWAFAILMAYSVFTAGMASINEPELWAIFGVLTAIPAEILRNYFGNLRKEQNARVGFAQPSLLNKIFGRGN